MNRRDKRDILHELKLSIKLYHIFCLWFSGLMGITLLQEFQHDSTSYFYETGNPISSQAIRLEFL